MRAPLILSGLLFSCQLLQGSPSPEQPPLEKILRTQWPQLTALNLDYWPEGSERYTGLLRRLQFSLPASETSADPRLLLRETLSGYLQQQQHPEADCVSVKSTRLEKQWDLTAEVVCR